MIIIDSQGFGDTRGFDKDLKINKAFEYVFSQIIDHFYIICITVNVTDKRFGPEMKYIYSAITSLFADNISDNFIIFGTHLLKSEMKNPELMEIIIRD